MDSIEYYNRHAGEFYENTVDIDMHDYLDRFTAQLPDGGCILDLGCGSGRDSAYFISQGFDVTAMDGSEEMCNLASIHIGQEVLQLNFSEMDFEEVFDGVWANASLLHVPRSEMEDILTKVIRSLKKSGFLYMSFHYGEEEEEKNDRYYTNYNTRTLKELIAKFDKMELIEIKKSQDVIPERDTLWIYAMVRKID